MSIDLIHYERNSPLPFTTQQGSPDSPTNAFELLQLELEYYYANHMNTNQSPPSNEELQFEACCIIFGAEIQSHDTSTSTRSWLHDLIMSSEDITRQARVRPTRATAKLRFTSLTIHGKDNIFQDCNLEALLQRHVDMLGLLNMDVGNDELQREACNIINQLPNSWEIFTTLITDLIIKSEDWLTSFRVRAKLPPASRSSMGLDEQPSVQGNRLNAQNLDFGIAGEGLSALDILPTLSSQSSALTVDSAKDSKSVEGVKRAKAARLNDSNLYRSLTRKLSRFVASTMSPRNPHCHVPSDEELQHQARWIMYDE